MVLVSAVGLVVMVAVVVVVVEMEGGLGIGATLFLVKNSWSGALFESSFTRSAVGFGKWKAIIVGYA